MKPVAKEYGISTFYMSPIGKSITFSDHYEVSIIEILSHSVLFWYKFSPNIAEISIIYIAEMDMNIAELLK